MKKNHSKAELCLILETTSIFLIHLPLAHVTLLTGLLPSGIYSADFIIPLGVIWWHVYAWCYQFYLDNAQFSLETQLVNFDNVLFQAAYGLSSLFSSLVSLTKQSAAA